MTKNQQTVLTIGAVGLVGFFLLSQKGKSVMPNKPTPQPPKPTNQNNVMVWLDPGHGGADPGAVNANGITEKSWNLEASSHITKTLQATGYRVGASRVVDASLAPRDSDGKWTTDRNKRVSNAKAAGAAVFVSLHYDCGLPTCEGTMVYHRDDVHSIALAKTIANALQIEAKEPTPIMSHTRSRFGGLYIRFFSGPSVLVELGRTGEAISLEQRKRRAQVVGNAIVQFMRSYNA